VDDARFDWLVTGAALAEAQTLPASTLTTTTEEQGTSLPTVVDPGCAEAWADLVRDDPAVTPESLEARLQLVYGELERAWEALDLRTARPFVSDALFNSLQYWINAYRAQGLRNVNEGATLTRWEMAKVERDKHYDAVTLRIFGTGCDYTLDVKTGKVLSGNRKTPRPYSEYWTLIRGAGVRGAPKGDKNCPGCGAPLKVSMAGNCEYCNALITSGDFDWVLSRIEQDDSYEG
jgi:predicted lipid-binding transport protein (Tim44 family)